MIQKIFIENDEMTKDIQSSFKAFEAKFTKAQTHSLDEM
jgi:hypothetical protein